MWIGNFMADPTAILCLLTPLKWWNLSEFRNEMHLTLPFRKNLRSRPLIFHKCSHHKTIISSLPLNNTLHNWFNSMIHVVWNHKYLWTNSSVRSRNQNSLWRSMRSTQLQNIFFFSKKFRSNYQVLLHSNLDVRRFAVFRLLEYIYNTISQYQH